MRRRLAATQAKKGTLEKDEEVAFDD